jgi:predicted nuclease with TOPRIM domain
LPALPPPAEPPQRSGIDYRGFVNRLADTAKAVVTVGDNLKRLEKEDQRIQTQVHELTKMVFDLSKQGSELSGQMKNIEKLAELTIKLRIMEEVEKMKTLLPRDDHKPVD